MPTRATASASARPAIPQEIWAIIAAGAVVAIGFGIVAPILPQFAKSFDVSNLQAALIVSMFALFRMLFAPVSGFLVDKVGERTTYVTGLLIVAASTGACAFAASYNQLLAFRALGGIGSTMFTVSAMGLLARLAPPAIRGRVTSLYGGAFIIGTMIGPVIGGGLGTYGLAVPFLVYAVGLVIAAGVAALNLSSASLRASAQANTSRPMTVRQALPLGSYRAVLFTGFATGMTNFGVRVALVPLFIVAVLSRNDLSWSPALMAGLAMTFFAVGNAGGVSFAGDLSDKIGRRPLMMAGTLVNGAATAVIGLSDNIVFIMTACVVAGLGAGMFFPVLQATVADIVGPDRSGGKVIGAQQMVQDLGAIIGPIACGAIADQAGFGPVFLLVGVLMCASALWWYRSPETRPEN